MYHTVQEITGEAITKSTEQYVLWKIFYVQEKNIYLYHKRLRPFKL